MVATNPLGTYFSAHPKKGQTEVARLLGVTPGRISQIHCGQPPSLELAIHMERVLGIPPSAWLPVIEGAREGAPVRAEPPARIPWRKMVVLKGKVKRPSRRRTAT